MCKLLNNYSTDVFSQYRANHNLVDKGIIVVLYILFLQ